MKMTKMTHDSLWKVKALLFVRGLYKRKDLKVDDVAKMWDISERVAFRHLAEADEIFKQLAPYIWFQPDLNQELVNKQLPKTFAELGLDKVLEKELAQAAEKSD